MRSFVVAGLLAIVVASLASADTADLPYAATAALLVDPIGQCRSMPDGTPCDDGAACAGSSVCRDGLCVSSSPTCRNLSDVLDRSYCSLETGGCVSQSETCPPFFLDGGGNQDLCRPLVGVDPATGQCFYDYTLCVPPGCFRHICNPATGACEVDLNDPSIPQCGTDDFCQPRPDCVVRDCFFESCSAQGSPQNCDSITNKNCTAVNPSSCQKPLPTNPQQNIINGCREGTGCVFSSVPCPAAPPCEKLVRDHHAAACCRYEPRDCAGEFGNAPSFDYACEVVGPDGVCSATLIPRFPIGVKETLIKPGKLFKMTAKGDFILPADDPTAEGGSLSFSGTTGGQTYPLPAPGWIGLGPGADGSRGFKFVDDVCKVSLAKRKRALKARCRVDTGDVGPLPEPGPVDVVLSIGDRTRYCAQCGGTPSGNQNDAFKHKDCSAPAACP